MHQLKDIQGSGQIVQLLKHLRIQSPFQKMLLIVLHWVCAITERVSHPTPSRSYSSRSPFGKSLHIQFARVSFFHKW
jgi:hypothetical protein